MHCFKIFYSTSNHHRSDKNDTWECDNELLKYTLCVIMSPLPPCPKTSRFIWFPVTQIYVSVSQRLCQSLFMRYFRQFLPMAFKSSDMVNKDETVNWLPFRDLGSIFKVTGDHYVSKLTLFTWYFWQFFFRWLSNSQIWWTQTRPWID